MRVTAGGRSVRAGVRAGAAGRVAPLRPAVPQRVVPRRRFVALVVSVALASAASGGAGLACGGGGGGGGEHTVDDPAGAVRVSSAAGVTAESVGRVRADVVAAVGHVRAIWPGAWADRVDVTVVAGARALETSAGSPGSAARRVEGVAAVAVVPIGGSGAGASSGAANGRLVVDAEVYERLSELGARVVTRHEVTHLASAAATPPDMPVWLVEGFADAVGHSGSGPGADRLAPELAADVAAGRLPADLPGDSAFTSAGGRIAQAYQQAWLACNMILDEVGVGGLVRFYRAVGTGSGTVATRIDSALAAILGTTRPQFVTAWRNYLATRLAP